MGKLTRAEKRAAKKENSLLEVKDTCVNCNQHIALDQRFCSYCGGKRIYNKLTWWNLLEDFADRFLNLENSFFKTFIALFKQPEDVIGGYMNGMRKKYLPAFSYFAIAITVAGITSFFIRQFFMEDMIAAQNDLYSAGPAIELQKSFNDKWLRTVMEYQSLFYFSIIPILALISKLVFWNYKKVNFVEHMVIYLYSYSHIAMITSIAGLLAMWNMTLYQIFGMLSIVVMILYMAYVLKRLFALDVAQIILKTALFGLINIIFLIGLGVAGAGIAIYLGATGALDDTEFVKQIKEKRRQEKEDALKSNTIMFDSISNERYEVIETPKVKDSLDL